MFFKSKKPEIAKEDSRIEDFQIITKLSQEFATSLDLSETLQNSLDVIIKRINAQAANVFLIEEKKQVFQCIASKHQAYLEDYEIPLTQGVMGKAVLQKKCIRVGDVRKDVREIAEFYFDLDNKTNFTTYSVLCSPLIAANECIGVIHCLNKKSNSKLFEESDRKLLETLSAPAALAIRNAKMAKELVDKNRIQKEIEIVGEIQKTLLSKNKKVLFSADKEVQKLYQSKNFKLLMIKKFGVKDIKNINNMISNKIALDKLLFFMMLVAFIEIFIFKFDLSIA